MVTRFLCACVLVAVAAASGALESARGYNVGGRPWPGGVVRYYNAATDQAWAVRRAVDAWNSSGAAVRFVAVPAARAQLRIEHFPRVACTINAEATVGYAVRSRVWIFHRNERSPYCNSYMAAQALAHEFGHVLGLKHEVRGCAAMNPVGTLQGPSLCTQARPWQWRCQLLTPDDVAGAVALYGGTVRPQIGPRDCDLYRAIQAPNSVKIAATQVAGEFDVSFLRPKSVAIPSLLLSRSLSPETFVVGWATSRCPTSSRAYAPHLWHVLPGARDHLDVALIPGTYCLSIWGFDSFGRRSARAAQLWVRIPGR